MCHPLPLRSHKTIMQMYDKNSLSMSPLHDKKPSWNTVIVCLNFLWFRVVVGFYFIFIQVYKIVHYFLFFIIFYFVKILTNAMYRESIVLKCMQIRY